MTIIAGQIITRAASTLFDDGTRWPESDLLAYLSDAQREVCLLKPTAYTRNEPAQLAPGTLQSLPAGGVSLIDLGGNLGTDGNTPGRSITQVDRTVLEASRPDWRNATADVSARHFIYDDRDPIRFHVYPPQPALPGYAEVVYCAVPDEITSTLEAIALPDIYETPLYYLVLARAYAKTSGTADFNKATMYQQLAQSLITGRQAAKQRLHPEQLEERTRR